MKGIFVCISQQYILQCNSVHVLQERNTRSQFHICTGWRKSTMDVGLPRAISVSAKTNNLKRSRVYFNPCN